jgi:hypothetical protein
MLPKSSRIHLERALLRPTLLILVMVGSALVFGRPLAASDSSLATTDTIRVPSGPLEAAAFSFAQALSELSGEQMTVVFAPHGIRLHLDDDGYAGLSARQAVASIRDFLREFDGGKTVVTRAAPVEWSSNRGFAEVLWVGRVSSTSHQVQRTLFLGLLRDGAEWRVDEVRFLR